MPKNDIKLLMVTDKNNNKVYNMHDNNDGTFTVTWGRYGTPGKNNTYPIKDWDKKYREKIGKGYKNVTDNTAKICEYKDNENVEINILLKAFLEHSRQYVSKFTESTAISDAAAMEAQECLNKMATIINSKNKNLDEFNQYLLKLFTIIPRKMAKVQDNLCHSIDNMQKYISEEQSMLDNLILQTKNQPKSSGTITIEEAFNFNITPCSDDEIKYIRDKLASDGFTRYKFNRAWKLVNPTREAGFKEYLEENNLSEEKDVRMYWHGTGTENILSIMSNGLLVRPANASYSGSCYGNGIYNAPNSDKASGYTSIAGSYWKGGSSNVAYMFINAVIMGKQFDCKDNYEKFDGMRISDLDLAKFTKHNLGYHSVYAHAGGYLKRDEAICYDPRQVACRYLVEFKI